MDILGYTLGYTIEKNLKSPNLIQKKKFTRTGPNFNSSSKPKYTISYTVDSSPCSNSAKETIAMAQTAITSFK